MAVVDAGTTSFLASGDLEPDSLLRKGNNVQLFQIRRILAPGEHTKKSVSCSKNKAIATGSAVPLTVEHDFPNALGPDGRVGGAVGHGPLLGLVAPVDARGVDLQNVGGPQHQVDALEAGLAAGVVHQDDVVADPAEARAPDGDGVKEDGEGRVGDGGHVGGDGLGDILALEGGWKVAAGVAS